VTYENIPDELQERDQWLMWDAGADTPRRPHWRGDFRVSWTDPDDWHTFEEAVAAANERESWGIGYVFAKGNEEYPRGLYGGLDLDGCVTGDGRPKDWLPSLEPFFENGGYMEYSPSGGGVHIPLAGLELPDWWADVALGEHEGVEAYESKFFTFTGDTLREAGDSVADTGPYVEDWLKAACEEIRGNRPWESDGADPTESARESAPSSATGNAREIAKDVDDLDARDVAEKTIVSAWNDNASTSGDNRAFYPTWNPGCNGTANIADRDGWVDTGTDSGSGGPLTMALIDMGEISHSGARWDDAADSLWWDAVDHLRDLGFPIREYEPDTADPMRDPDGGDDSTSWTSWESVLMHFKDSETDDKKARRLAAMALLQRHDFLYIDADDRLLIYDPDAGVFERGGEREIKGILVRELGSEFSTHDRNEIVATIQDFTATDKDELNAAEHDEKLLCVQNGVLDLETRALHDHDPEYKFTRSVPVEYDETADAPNAEAFLENVTTASDEKKTLEEMIGAALHPEYLKSKFLFLFGEGQNGKGIYFQLLSHLLGDDNVEGRGLHELADERFAKADLHGKLANIGGDIDDRKLKNVGELKRLTSNTDPVTAERKYGQPFKFVNNATLFFAANEPPSIEDKKRSMARRIVPIHMEKEFVENPNPDDPLQEQSVPEEELLGAMTTDEELSGLLNLALDGMDRLVKSGDVSLALDPMERITYYQRFSDPIYRFATDCITKAAGERVEKADVYELYKDFSEAEGHGKRHDSVFWREFKRVFHCEEVRPRIDGEKGPRFLADAAFTHEAIKKYATGKLVDKYGDAADHDDDDDGGDGDPPVETGHGLGASRIADVATDPTGYATVTAEVLTTEHADHEDKPALRATVKDTSTAIDVIAWHDDATLTEGETVRLENAKVNEYQGSTQLVLRKHVTTVSRIQQGVGHTPGVTPEDGQGTLAADAAPDREAATDGGEEPDPEGDAEDTTVPADAEGSTADATRLCEIVRSEGGDLARGTLFSKAGERHDLPPDKAERALDRATTDGRLIDDGGTIRNGG